MKSEDNPIIQTIAEPLQQYLKKAADEGTPPQAPQAPKEPVDSTTVPFRPIGRQPLALLTVLDDGSRTAGEEFRIRSSRFLIGREKGDVVIPFDPDLSGLHAELRCQLSQGLYSWFLIDRASTNGTLLRAYKASLAHNTELMLGGKRYTFELPDTPNQPAETDILRTQPYRALTHTVHEKCMPRLVESGVTPDRAQSFPVVGEVFLGRDKSKCQIAIENDPYLSPQHARIYQNDTGRWMIEDRKSMNGIWIRIKKFKLDRLSEFQLGQQRFRFQPHLGS